MFDATSRYYRLETATYTTADGRELRYKRRRFIPRADSLPTLVEVTVTDGDRLDQIAARTIASGEQFWRICDAEDAMNPPELTAEPGRKLRVPIPQVNQ